MLMAEWLFNSEGKPIAFVNGNDVFTRTGRFLGRLTEKELWRGEYQGEIVRENRLLYKMNNVHPTHARPPKPVKPAIPSIPGSKGSNGLPSGYRDVDLVD
jgi:hypothetical protein